AALVAPASAQLPPPFVVPFAAQALEEALAIAQLVQIFRNPETVAALQQHPEALAALQQIIANPEASAALRQILALERLIQISQHPETLAAFQQIVETFVRQLLFADIHTAAQDIGAGVVNFEAAAPFSEAKKLQAQAKEFEALLNQLNEL